MALHQVLDPIGTYRVPPGLCALGVMTKAPRAGQVKTRLVPPLTPEEAAEINRCFLRDVGGSIIEACVESPARGIAVYTPVGLESAYEDILPPEFQLIPQRGRHFGERLTLAAEDLFRIGFESLCLINSDSPTVPSANFAQALAKLREAGDRVVLGPSFDGGYYLLGIKQLHYRLFEEIDWSTSRVLEQTRQRANELGLEVHELSMGLDVDDQESLARLRAELFDSNLDTHVAINTRAFLEAVIQREAHDRT